MGITETAGSRLTTARDRFLQQVIRPVTSSLVYEAFAKVDRHFFAPKGHLSLAYKDAVIPLTEGATISQPILVAQMIGLADLTGTERVLEIGTASGYSAAVLSYLAREVYSVEYNKKLARKATKKLKKLGYTNVEVVYGDGALGVPEKAPFDVIIVTATAREIPKALQEQLTEGGRIVIPLSDREYCGDDLIQGLKYHGSIVKRTIFKGVLFVPLMSSEAGCWTEKSLKRLFELKKRALVEAMEKSKGRKIGSVEELIGIIARDNKMKPENIDLAFFINAWPLSEDDIAGFELQETS